jgi:hypothetical protein
MLIEAWECLQNCPLERLWNKLLKQAEDTQDVKLNFETAEIQDCISLIFTCLRIVMKRI